MMFCSGEVSRVLSSINHSLLGTPAALEHDGLLKVVTYQHLRVDKPPINGPYAELDE